MNLFINSPAYYTQEHGVIEEVYAMCRMLSKKIDITKYTSLLDTIGIVAIIAPDEELKTKWKEEKIVSSAYRMASISLRIDYDKFMLADINIKKSMILENILKSLYVIKRKLKNDFDYFEIEKDILFIAKDFLK